METETATPSPSLENLFLLWESVHRIISDPGNEESPLTEDHENRIRRHYNQLLSNLSVPDVVTQMFQSEKLTAKEHEYIRQFYTTPIKASEELLNIIIRNTRDVYECFLESLKKTKQHHVYQMLTCDGESVCPGDQSVSEHSRLIRQNFDWLTESLDLDSGLLTELFAQEVLSCREYGQILSEKERCMRNETFLCIISRKSVDDFKTFLNALKDTLQEEIFSRLTDKQVGTENENITRTTVERTIPTKLSGSSGKRIPPKTQPKPKKQPPTSPSSKQISIRPTSLLIPRIQTSNPNRMEKQKHPTQKQTVISTHKHSVETLQRNFRELQNELQTEVSTKIVQLRQRTSRDSIWKICFRKILEESQNIKRQSIMQTKAKDKKCERVMQEILHRESECNIKKDGIQQEKTRTQKQLEMLQETVHRLDKRLSLTEDKNKNLSDKLKTSENRVESLQPKEQEVNEKVSIIEKLKEQATQVNETRAQLRITEEKLKENDLVLKMTTAKLKETQEKLNESLAKLEEFQSKLTVQNKGTDESKSKAELRYTLERVLVQTIRTKAAEEEKEISGMTILDKELFVVSQRSSQVEVYDSMKFSVSRRWNLKELIHPWDIGSCNINKCLYIWDYKGNDHLSEILRVDPNGKLIRNWSTGKDYGRVSVTVDSNIILIFSNDNKLNEYSPDGHLIREINLSNAGICHPWHATKLTNGHFVVSHGLYVDELHRVCVLDGHGKLKESFGGKCGWSIGQMDRPVYLIVDENECVMVADYQNSRVLLLDSDLKFQKEILSKEKHKLQFPRRILLDRVNGRMFVADNEWDSDKKKLTNGRILIFDLKY